MKNYKWIILVLLLALIGLPVLVYTVDKSVEFAVKDQLYDSVETIPAHKVGVVLGTSKRIQGGGINLYYKYRIDAAEQLFKSGKIDFILISGDNSTKEYNEPEMMQNDLIKRGIPEHKIYLDYAGFRTLDSIVRANKIFGLNEFTVISQPFHNQRALFIANRKGLEVVGFNAKKVGEDYGFKTQIREKFARVKMVLDLLIGKDPKFLGERIEIK